jgi:uncharacterized protein (TIGR00106 family)
MVVAELALDVIGEGTSEKTFVEAVAEVLDERGLAHEVTPTATVVEGELDEIFDAVRACHEACARRGAKRIVTTVRVDDRRDRRETMESMVEGFRT